LGDCAGLNCAGQAEIFMSGLTHVHNGFEQTITIQMVGPSENSAVLLRSSQVDIYNFSFSAIS
jgi:hypothetical protein